MCYNKGERMAERLTEAWIEERLLQLVDLLGDAFDELAGYQERLALAERSRDEHEAELLVEGEIKGKNKEEREANLLLAMKQSHFSVSRAQGERDRFRRHVEGLEREFAALRAIARMRGGEPR
jgi:hypothetical protein